MESGAAADSGVTGAESGATAGSGDEGPWAGTAEEPELRVHELHSRVYGNRRKLRVLLPPRPEGAGAAAPPYPVLYLNDAQNLFAPETAHAGVTWRVPETVAELVRAGEIPPLVVVGIDHAGPRRIHEFLPWPDPQLPVRLPAPWPRGERYPRFLLEEVVPFVESRYPVDRDHARRGLGGSSLGALVTLVTAIRRPGHFGRLLLESGAYHLSGRRLLEELEGWAAASPTVPLRVWLGAGTEETDPIEGADPARDTRQVARVLVEAGVARERIATVVEEGAHHREEAWARRLPEALRFLFSPEPSPPGAPQASRDPGSPAGPAAPADGSGPAPADGSRPGHGPGEGEAGDG